MLRAMVIGVGLLVAGTAFACPGKEGTTAAVEAKSAMKADGSHCNWTTGRLASQVLDEGNTWTYSGTVQTADNAGEVNAPVAVGPNAGLRIVANEQLEKLLASGIPVGRVYLEGKTLLVNGVSYVVLTQFNVLNS